jgi:hypothetical protein
MRKLRGVSGPGIENVTSEHYEEDPIENEVD